MNLGLAKSFNYVQDLSKSSNQTFSSNPFQEQSFPDQYKYLHSDNPNNVEQKLKEVKKGTTTLAFKFQGGVIMCADSRASEGNLHSTQNIRKIIEVNPELLATIAGGAGDCIYWEDYVACQARKFELANGEKVSVAAASRMLINIIYNKKGSNFSMGCMFGGVDKTGTHLYYLDDDGMRIKGDVFSLGSGSTYALGVFDSEFKWDMTLDQATRLAEKCISYACHRDSGSAGFVRVYHIHNNGWDIVSDNKLANDFIMGYKKQNGFSGVGDECDERVF